MKFHSVNDIRAFMLAGNATITVRSTITGNRFTYRIRQAKDKPLWFVSVLTGPDNETAFSYIGIIRDKTFSHTAKSKVTSGALSAKAAEPG